MQRYTVGDRVTQVQYGDGTITNVNEYHTKIDFDVHGLRTFISERVNLVPSTTPAPVKVVSRRKRVGVAKASSAPVNAS